MIVEEMRCFKFGTMVAEAGATRPLKVEMPQGDGRLGTLVQEGGCG
jgi:hypothetical protein